MSRVRSAAMNLGALALGCVAAFGILEIALRIKNPFESRVRVDRIVLPVHRTYVLVGGPAGGPTDTVIHTTNSLGFRGPEPPADGLGRHLSLIVIGGSTTEGYYLPDGATWPERLKEVLAPEFPNVWVNNAGFDGHSTYGHVVLMRDYVSRLKPRVALFLVGANDVGADYRSDDAASLVRRGLRLGSLEGFVKSAAPYSEVMATALILFRYARARARGLTHFRLDLNTQPSLPYPEPDLAALLADHERRWIPPYEERLRELLRVTRESGIVPVMITQPALFGGGRDDVTGVDLAGLKFGPWTGHTQWKVLEAYNEAMRRVARANGVFLVDLAAELPKSSRFFYDGYHFTAAGADHVARIVGRRLAGHLKAIAMVPQ